MGDQKHRFLILGGTGFVGRHLVDHLLKSDVASKIRVVDKVPPQMAWLNSAHKEVYENPTVEFKSANLINPAHQRIGVREFVLNGQEPIGHGIQASTSAQFKLISDKPVLQGDRSTFATTSCKAAFEDPEGPYDFVINLAAETKINLPDCVYEEGILKLSRNCAREALGHRPRRYIEVSSGHMYTEGKKPAQEHFSLEPWTVTAQLKLAVEQDLQEMKDLDYVILRPAIVYGVADKHGIVPRILVGAVYKHLKETMKFPPGRVTLQACQAVDVVVGNAPGMYKMLEQVMKPKADDVKTARSNRAARRLFTGSLLWTKDLKMDTVHVSDLCRAIWHVCLHGKSGDIYNVVDQGHTTQGKVTEIISERFSISHSYWGTAASLIAKTDMESTVEQVNEKHLSPWAEACLKDNITNTPLSPYLCQELLTDRNLCLDGSKLVGTGFTYLVPEMTKERINEIVDDYVEMGLFPRSLLL